MRRACAATIQTRTAVATQGQLRRPVGRDEDGVPDTEERLPDQQASGTRIPSSMAAPARPR